MGWNRDLILNKPATEKEIEKAVLDLPSPLSQGLPLLGFSQNGPGKRLYHALTDISFDEAKPTHVELHGAYGWTKETDLLVTAMTEALSRRLEKAGFEVRATPARG